jgi:hypothetical protein
MKREEVSRAMNRLAKWRTVFTGWQLGTRPKGDPECDVVSDHREATITPHAEYNTLARMLLTIRNLHSRQVRCHACR